MAWSSFMLNSFCSYTIVILVFFDDSQFGFVFTEMIKCFACHACIAMKMLAIVVFVNMDILLSCVKCLFTQTTRFLLYLSKEVWKSMLIKS